MWFDNDTLEIFFWFLILDLNFFFNMENAEIEENNTTNPV